jgi:hypothetical protein
MRRMVQVPTKKMWVEWEDGAGLSQSRKKPGDYSPLTRDSDNNLGHVTLRDVDAGGEAGLTDPQTVFVFVTDERSDADESGEGELVALAALAVLGVMVAAARKGTPHLKRWWHDTSLPFLESTKTRLSRTRATRGEVLAAESSTVTGTGSAQSSPEVFAALQDHKASMSSAEARDRFVAALVARLFSEEQLNALRNARIEDDGGALELASVMETLTPRQLEESITTMLEANPSWPDDETVAELGRVLGRRISGDDVPVRHVPAQPALRLTDGKGIAAPPPGRG